MTENIVDVLIGQYCKVIMDEPNKTKASVFYGILKDVDHSNNFIILESSAFPICPQCLPCSGCRFAGLRMTS